MHLTRLYSRQFAHPLIPGHLSFNPARLSRTYPQSLLITRFAEIDGSYAIKSSDALTERQITEVLFPSFQRHACELIDKRNEASRNAVRFC